MRKIVNSTYFTLEQLRRSDALLMGRKTYQGFATAWPGRSGRPETAFAGDLGDRRRLSKPASSGNHVTRGESHPPEAEECVGHTDAVAQPGSDLVQPAEDILG